jgi:hypothetical protein
MTSTRTFPKLFGGRMVTVVFLILLSLSPVAQTQTRSEWIGEYTYTANLGRTASGTTIIFTYDIEITAPNAALGAVIKAEGYQTDEAVRCDTRTSGHQIDLLFNSYPNGSTTNQFGVNVYTKGDELLSLIRLKLNNQTKYQVVWGKLNSDVQRKVFFKKVR